MINREATRQFEEIWDNETNSLENGKDKVAQKIEEDAKYNKEDLGL